MSNYKNAVCRGCWQLGNNCGKCERCIETKPVNDTKIKRIADTKEILAERDALKNKINILESEVIVLEESYYLMQNEIDEKDSQIENLQKSIRYYIDRLSRYEGSVLGSIGGA